MPPGSKGSRDDSNSFATTVEARGLSTRNLPDDFQVSDYQRDLETVVDHLNLSRPILMGHAVFGHVAIRYAVLHQERVEGLVLFPMATTMRWMRFLETARESWELFLHQQVGGSALPQDQRRLAIDRLRQSTAQRDSLVCTSAFQDSGILDVLPQVNAPSLIIHPRDYPIYPQDESIRIAAGIAGARMVTIDGSVALGDATQGLAALDDFLGYLSDSPSDLSDTENSSPGAQLSDREVEVLRLIAAGKSNQQIADELVISLNTVRRHVSNIFDKTGVTNRAQAAVYAGDHGLA